ncbi:hypothetical protein OSB04_009598 [Centaurea solstitialis]|uniref:Uncharacterized protein n=1 Tax=Centaurea solstitialis TaxID=347529 RepID=A0AA38T5Y0_9ASTR|nr:hypothetical protein OSB04_009598 [Centaurea solstitialis]
MTFMLVGGYFLKDVPIYIAWLRYLSINYHAYMLLLKVQYGTITSIVDGMKLDSGFKDVCALAAMALVYCILSYLCLRHV